MAARRRTGRRSLGAAAIFAVVGGGACAAAFAFASGSGARGPEASAGRVVTGAGLAAKTRSNLAATRPRRPRITGSPGRIAVLGPARFTFTGADAGASFQCRVDRGGWRRCRSPLTLRGLGAGEHRFRVRVRSQRRSSSAAAYRWTMVEPRQIVVEPDLAALAPLFPGAPPQPLPVVVRNPNEVPVLLTDVRVVAGDGAPGCDGAANLALRPARIPAPPAIPAGGALSLPAPGIAAPTVALRDLPVNQDACQGAELSLAFSGEAHG